MSATRQFNAILRTNLMGLTQRLGTALTIVIGITCAVGVLVSMLAMGVGARRQAMGDVRPDRVILTNAGSQAPMDSSISKEAAFAILDIPGIRKNARGEPIALLEAEVIVEARKRSDGARINFPLYGVSSGLSDLRPELHLTAGRMFQPGLHELIASNLCAREYVGFGIGEHRSLRGSDWTIVGHFDQGHGEISCIVYADANSILSAFGRDTYNQVTVMLQSPAGFDAFVAALKASPGLRVQAKRESEVVAQSMKGFNGILKFASYFVGTIMAAGATLGAVNSLYALVDSRRRELATLRAIGFRSGPILISTVAESMLLAIPGALLGAGLAWMFFNGLSASPFGFSFQLAVTPSLAALGVGWALAMGLAGGILPALRAAHIPVTMALRST